MEAEFHNRMMSGSSFTKDYDHFDRQHPNYEFSARHAREGYEFVRGMKPRLSNLFWIASNRKSFFPIALMNFGLARRELAADASELLSPIAWSALASLPAMDAFRTTMQWDWNLLPEERAWHSHLYTSADYLVDAFWFLRQGKVIPAAAIARRVLERRTLNLANEFEMTRNEDESDSDFITRVWQGPRRDAEAMEVGHWWAWLSEILHGRKGTTAFGPEAHTVLSIKMEENLHLHDAISKVLSLCLSQIRGCLSLVARDAKKTEYEISLMNRWEVSGSLIEPFPLPDAARPLDFFEANSQRSDHLTLFAEIYRGTVLQRFDPEEGSVAVDLFVDAFLERRGRAISRARQAFRDEAEARPDAFDPRLLMSRLFQDVCVSELARLLQGTVDGNERVALLTAADALDGASRAWLEDSDYSMTCLRVLLEQIARLRTYRLKPAKAVKLEASGNASSARWLEAAGWRRLGVLMRAANEFAHMGLRTRTVGARKALEELQPDGLGPQTGRGNALLSVRELLSFELYERLKKEDQKSAELYLSTITLTDEAAYVSAIEAYLENAFALKEFDFGEPDFARRADRSASKER